jgi:hypothetical protein
MDSTDGTPRERPTVPYAETISKTAYVKKSVDEEKEREDVQTAKIVNQDALSGFLN